MNQRGFVWWVYLAAFGGALAVFWGAAAYFDHRGYERGRTQVLNEWARARLAAEEQQRQREARVAQELLLADKRAVAADQQADESERKWKEARRDARRLAEVVRPISEPAASVPDVSGRPLGSGLRAPSGDVDSGAVVRLTADFVRLHDAAWTDPAGKPVFGFDSWNPGPTFSGATVPELLDAHEANAKNCSADRRELKMLLDRIEAAERGWGRP